MKESLQEDLFQRFPELFIQRKSLYLSPMSFGIEVGDGWFDPIESSCILIKDYLLYKTQKGIQLITYEDFSELTYDAKTKYFVIPEFIQIKEKQGELIIYIDHSDDYIKGVLDMATMASRNMCENCGRPSKIRKVDFRNQNICKPCERKIHRHSSRGR